MIFGTEIPKGESISGRELLDRVYTELFFEQVEELVEFEEPLRIILEQDVDHHRTDTALMRYNGGKIINLDGVHWIIGKGTPTGSYLSDRHGGDIRIGRGQDKASLDNYLTFNPFYNSAIFVSRKGNLGINRGMFKGLGLQDAVKQYDLTPHKKFTIYKPEFVDVCVERIEAKVREMSQ